jgi:hypothetical protein
MKQLQAQQSQIKFDELEPFHLIVPFHHMMRDVPIH